MACKMDDVKISWDNIPETLRVFCYTCNTTVDGKDLPYHLLFGRLDCKLCTAKLATCERFHNVYYSKKLLCKHSESGYHEFLKWQTSCAEYLSYFLRKELVIERFCQNKKGSPSTSEVLNAVKEYISNLSYLENYNPWEIELKSCKKYLEGRNITFKSNVDDNKIANAEPNKTSSKDSSQSQNGIVVKSSNTPSKNDALISNEAERGSDSREGVKNLPGEQSTSVAEDPSYPNVSKSVTLQASAESDSMKNCPSNGKKKGVSNDSRKTLARQELNIHEPDDSDEGLLQTFNIERLDQAVEYVTVEDDCREKGIAEVSEMPSTKEKCPKDQEISCGKRKAPDDDSFCASKTSRTCCKSLSPSDGDFKPPDKVAGDRYLVIHFPTEGCPEECPNCYCEFCPSMLTVNCSTFVSTIICAECNLTIYVLPD